MALSKLKHISPQKQISLPKEVGTVVCLKKIGGVRMRSNHHYEIVFSKVRLNEFELKSLHNNVFWSDIAPFAYHLARSVHHILSGDYNTGSK